MAENEVRIAAGPLQDFTQKVFEKAGLPPQDAAIEAEVLVWANLRGIDSHGVLRIPWYLRSTEAGDMNPRPNIQTLKETPAVLYLDADRAYGPVVTVLAMQKAIEKARQVGIGWALIRNLTHQGAMAYYTELAARRDMAGIAFVCNPPNMAPTGARKAGVHNSPLAIGVPTGDGSMLYDIATSVAAGGKIRVAQDKRISIPEEWALDENGDPTTDPDLAKYVRPFGGYKGYGMALMFETLSSLMMGRPLLSPWTHEHEDRPSMYSQNSVVAAIDIATFTDPEQYKKDVDDTIAGIKGLPRQDEAKEIMVPGDPEKATEKDRLTNGIPLPVGTVEKIFAAAEQFSLDLPPELA